MLKGQDIASEPLCLACDRNEASLSQRGQPWRLPSAKLSFGTEMNWVATHVSFLRFSSQVGNLLCEGVRLPVEFSSPRVIPPQSLPSRHSLWSPGTRAESEGPVPAETSLRSASEAPRGCVWKLLAQCMHSAADSLVRT